MVRFDAVRGRGIASDPAKHYADHRGNIVPCGFHPDADVLAALATRRADMPICNRGDVGADPMLSPSPEAVTRFQQKGP